MHFYLRLKKSIQSFFGLFFNCQRAEKASKAAVQRLKSDKRTINKKREVLLIKTAERVKEHHLPVNQHPTSAPGPRVDSVTIVNGPTAG